MRHVLLAIIVSLTLGACLDFNTPEPAQEDPRFSKVQESASLIDRTRLVPVGMYGNQSVAFDLENKAAVVGNDTIPLPILDNRIFRQGGHTLAWVGEDARDVLIMDMRDRSIDTVRVQQEDYYGLRVDPSGVVLIHTDSGWSPIG